MASLVVLLTPSASHPSPPSCPPSPCESLTPSIAMSAALGLLSLLLFLLHSLFASAFQWIPPPSLTCDAHLHSLSNLFSECPLPPLNHTLSHLPLYGSVISVTPSTLLSLLSSPPSPPPPTFASLPFIPTPTPPPSSTAWALLLIFSPFEPFSLHLLPIFHALAYTFPHLLLLSLDWREAQAWAGRPTPFNASIVIPSLLSPLPPSSPSPHSFFSVLRHPLSLSTWWASSPHLLKGEPLPPSLSVTSPYVVRALPSLLLFHHGVLVHHLHKWPRSYHHLVEHVQGLTGMVAGELPQWAGEEGDGEGEGEDEEVEEEDWEVLYDLTAQVDVGLVCSVVGMTAVHWLHRWKERLETWEALARPHAAM